MRDDGGQVGGWKEPRPTTPSPHRHIETGSIYDKTLDLIMVRVIVVVFALFIAVVVACASR